MTTRPTLACYVYVFSSAETRIRDLIDFTARTMRTIGMAAVRLSTDVDKREHTVWCVLEVRDQKEADEIDKDVKLHPAMLRGGLEGLWEKK